MHWHTLGSGYGVLEIHEQLTGGVGLELQVLVTDAGSLAWWVLDDGTLVRSAAVGLG